MAWEAAKDLTIEDIEVAPPKAHEVRIEVYYTGVCHTGIYPTFDTLFLIETGYLLTLIAPEKKIPTHYLEKIPRAISQSSSAMRVPVWLNPSEKG